MYVFQFIDFYFIFDTKNSIHFSVIFKYDFLIHKKFHCYDPPVNFNRIKRMNSIYFKK